MSLKEELLNIAKDGDKDIFRDVETELLALSKHIKKTLRADAQKGLLKSDFRLNYTQHSNIYYFYFEVIGLKDAYEGLNSLESALTILLDNSLVLKLTADRDGIVDIAVSFGSYTYNNVEKSLKSLNA